MSSIFNKIAIAIGHTEEEVVAELKKLFDHHSGAKTNEADATTTITTLSTTAVEAISTTSVAALTTEQAAAASSGQAT